PFGVALISHDENAKCYNQLFTSINALAAQEFNQPCLIDHVMADGALGITSSQTVFPHSPRMMCWFHMIQKCRLHRNLVTKEQWWITKLPCWYEDAAFGKPSTNNGC
ncbi:unnamed protein product, partial [Didymodactylos carnosus]